VIGISGMGGLAYAVYLWPKIGLTLVGGIVVLFGLSFLVARRISRHQADPRDHEANTLF
jgi:heme exporter protein D